MENTFEVVGFREVDFIDENSGRPVRGLKLYLSHLADDVQGVVTSDVWVPASCRGDYSPKLGDVIYVFRNEKGKCTGVMSASF